MKSYFPASKKQLLDAKRPLLLFVALTFLAFAGDAAAGVIVPAGLSEGQSYRLAFVTSGTTKQNSGTADIAYWDDFVEIFAGRSTFTDGANITYRAIASTPTVNARYHLESDTSDGWNTDSVPIYNMRGQLVATDWSDLWDGTITNTIRWTESRDLISPTSTAPRTWTGTTSIGLSRSTLGNGGTASYGSIGPSSGHWIHYATNGSTDHRYRVYGLSDVITIPSANPPTPATVPEPSTLSVFGIWLLGCALRRNRRKGKA